MLVVRVIGTVQLSWLPCKTTGCDFTGTFQQLLFFSIRWFVPWIENRDLSFIFFCCKMMRLAEVF